MRMLIIYGICFFIITACESSGNHNNNQILNLDGGLISTLDMKLNDHTSIDMNSLDNQKDFNDLVEDQGGGEEVDLQWSEDMNSSFSDQMIVMDMMLDMDVDSMFVGERPPANIDSDGDGLMDLWEWQAQNRESFDWEKADSDGDGIRDGDEDEDEDGMNALMEQWLSQYQAMPQQIIIEHDTFHPLYFDMLIELDQMQDHLFARDALDLVIESFASIQGNHPLHAGINLHIYTDETLANIPVASSVEQRQNLFAQHPATYFDPMFPTQLLVHVISATQRDDQAYRAGEVIGHPEDVEKTGVLIYQTYINAIHPRCGFDDPVDPVPFITSIEAQAGTLIHELGHVLQLGHDTDMNGENPWNVMTLLDGCVSTRQRFHGEGNDDRSLGSIAMERASRFSQQAIDLMRVDLKLSVDVSELLVEGQGLEH